MEHRSLSTTCTVTKSVVSSTKNLPAVLVDFIASVVRADLEDELSSDGTV